ncbi:CNNM domain-containing protein [Microlunatus parietis]|uniref:CBS domain containing-hemolysin-like protein n=1 Tax=Microlunatus parietis TaxID=682979 RepID=A0A7Y9I3B7_9ACTN|nr:CNNM domain-containing protein [Microlunatus parietis]NYE69459.1 CBS domain containing-hemolysin-like protein [Microlunatus parietis]
MTDHPAVIIPVTIGLIIFSAFFVAVEFALLAAKRHRLEDAAASSRSARAALRSSTELTVLLAGAQLGITAVTVALGAITKPAVHHWLLVPLELAHLPGVVADVISFVLALFIVTFLHLVIGEMAPKSWAIAHPERSATLLALPMRGFMALTRPLLRALNGAANWCLRRVGVTPVNEVATGQTSDDLRQLVEHSANVGALDARFSAQLTEALQLERLTVSDLVPPGSSPATVRRDATVADLQLVAVRSGHQRIVVTDDEGRPTGMVHTRDTLTVSGAAPIGPLIRPVLRLPAATSVAETLAAMRSTNTQLAVATTDTDPLAGVVTITDVMKRLLPAVGVTTA